MPLAVTGPATFNLLAMWSQNTRAGIRYPSEAFEYPCGQVVEAYESLLDDDCVVAGDFNHHTRWDEDKQTRDFTAIVDAYRNHGLTSAWHAARDLEIGDSSEPATHWFQYQKDQPYMIDYCFVPSSWTDRIRATWIGGYEAYGSTKPRSDHAPLLVDLAF